MTDTDGLVKQILTSYDTITIVGASAALGKAAHRVPAYMQRHGWRIIPVNPHAREVARQAVTAGASALWLQLGISSAEARDIAEGAGLLYVENRCLAVEQRRLGLDAPRA